MQDTTETQTNATLTACPVCHESFGRITKHISDRHPEEAERQEQMVLKYYTEGMSAETITKQPGILYTGKTSVVRILRRHFTPEQMEENRKKNISKAGLAAYATGERDWINDINTERNKSEEGRAKNSEGLKRVYDEGERIAWNAGLTAKTDERLAVAAEKQSKAMLELVEKGTLVTLFKSGPEHIAWKEDRGSVSNSWRDNLGFQKQDRQALYKRADFKCQKCGVPGSLLDVERALLNDPRLTLECDHILPISQGGQRDWENNGQVLCSRCHMIKTLTEKTPRRILEIENRYNLAPAITLKAMLGGDFDPLSGVWSKDGFSIFIAPLTKTEAETSQSLKVKSKEGVKIIYSDEWYNKREIVISMIKSRLGMTEKTVYGRDTDVRKMSKEESAEFFGQNHISGNANALFAVGLYFESVLVSAISFRTPFVTKHKGKLEIARFASKTGHSVVGGFSKMMSFAKPLIREAGFSTVLTYADLRFGTGAVYSKNGFTALGETKLDYGYTDGSKRLNRFKFRAQDGMSEAAVAASKGVYKIYGCGSGIFEMTI